LRPPPPVTTLHLSPPHGPPAEILGQRRAIAPIMPRLMVEDGEAWLVIPDEADYPQ